jgi:hypothetical protein
MTVINCIYHVKLDLSGYISNFIEWIPNKDKNPTSMLMGIASLVKTDFKKVDENFKSFGVNYLEIMKEYFQSAKSYCFKFEKNFIREAFSQLMLNNMGFSQSELFPDKDIGMIKTPLQVELLLDGKNFILLPNVLVKCSDIHFNFK